MSEPSHLVWIDLEMTGLDPRKCVIVEIATIITDADLNVIAEGPNLVIHQPEEHLAAMEPVVVAMHTRSGLLDRIRTSITTLEQAEEQTLAFVQQHCLKDLAPLCGNSIWKDKQFIETYMPTLNRYLHYRCVDVSSIKELTWRWYEPLVGAPPKRETHRALDDIRESIEELRFYRQKVFRSVPA